jgi:hypothetical protein
MNIGQDRNPPAWNLSIYLPYDCQMRYTCANLLDGIPCCSQKVYVCTNNISFSVTAAFKTYVIANITPSLRDLIL